MLHNLIRPSCFDLGYHERLRRRGDYNCTWEMERARCVHSCESCVAAGGAEYMGNGSQIGREVFKTAEDVVADAPIEIVSMQRVWFEV
jgi:hypothetical protein